jgi:two-component system chemotaxis sensor kinase CheA
MLRNIAQKMCEAQLPSQQEWEIVISCWDTLVESLAPAQQRQLNQLRDLVDGVLAGRLDFDLLRPRWLTGSKRFLEIIEKQNVDVLSGAETTAIQLDESQVSHVDGNVESMQSPESSFVATPEDLLGKSWDESSKNSELTLNIFDNPPKPIEAEVQIPVSSTDLQIHWEIQEMDLGMGSEFLPKAAEIHGDDLQQMEQAVLEMESGASDSMDFIKRLLHTLKGDFGVIGITDYSALIHDVEESIENGHYSPEFLLRLKDFLQGSFVYFLQGQVPRISDQIRNAIWGVSAVKPVEAPTAPLVTSGTNVDEEAIDRNLREDASLVRDFVLESKDALEQVIPQLMDLENGSHETIHTLFRVVHTIKGLTGFMGLQTLGSFAHKLENYLARVREQIDLLDSFGLEVLRDSFDLLYEMILAVATKEKGGVLKYPTAIESILHQLEALQSDGFVPGAPVLHAEPVQTKPPSMEAMAPSPTVFEEVHQEIQVSAPSQQQSQLQRTETSDELIRVSIRRLDQLIDTIGETVIAHSMILADPNLRSLQDLLLEKKLAQSTLLLRQIQEQSMSLRMVPIQGVFQKMARLVRDLSKKMNKNVHLNLVGEETELDKGIVEQIADPLLHMVRNALDHGIETISEREVVGKTPQSQLSLRAFNRSGAIVIEIEDDGRGLDAERILEKAIDRGLVTSDVNLSDQEIWKFIFHPGFSTADKISDISGRGVGMDVVRRNIEALRGSIVIQSEKGRGTLFSIRLPLTLAIIDGMVVRCGTHRFIIPTLSIVQSIQAQTRREVIMEPDGTLIAQFQGSNLELCGVNQLLGMHQGPVIADQCIWMVVEDMEGRRVGLLFDEILGQQQIVIKGLGPWVGALPGVAGGTIMNDGTVSLILDVPEMIRLVHENTMALKLLSWNAAEVG